MRAYVRGQMVRSGKGARAHITLERLVARVYAQVARELVGAREPPRTPDHGACMRPLTDRRLTRSIRILARLERQKLCVVQQRILVFDLHVIFFFYGRSGRRVDVATAASTSTPGIFDEAGVRGRGVVSHSRLAFNRIHQLGG